MPIYAEFVDGWGARVRIQRASAAFGRAPRAWIFHEANGLAPSSPFIDAEQAHLLARGLLRFIRDAKAKHLGQSGRRGPRQPRQTKRGVRGGRRDRWADRR